MSPAALVTSAFALHAAHIPPAAVQAGQAAFTALGLFAPQSFVSAGVLDMAYTDTVSAVTAIATMNFFTEPPCGLWVPWYLSMPF